MFMEAMGAKKRPQIPVGLLRNSIKTYKSTVGGKSNSGRDYYKPDILL